MCICSVLIICLTHPDNEDILHNVDVYNHHGTVHGATLTTDRFGNPNSAYSFNGSTDYIEIPNHDQLDLLEQSALTI